MPEKNIEKTDQTSFAAEQVLLEEPVNYDVVSKVGFFKSKTGKIVSILTALFIILLILIIGMYFAFKKQAVSEEVVQEVVEEQQDSLDPLIKRIKALDLELQDADPTKQELPFPPVEMNIVIDKVN